MQADEGGLVRRIAAGDEGAFEDVYDRYGRALYAYLLGRTGRADVAEDLLQEVMMRLVRSRERVGQVRSLRAWLYTLARNEWIRRHGRERPLPSPAPAESSNTPLQDESNELRQALARLEPERAEVVTLKLQHDLTFAQIGEVLAISPNTAASRYRYALRDLERILETTDVRR